MTRDVCSGDTDSDKKKSSAFSRTRSKRQQSVCVDWLAGPANPVMGEMSLWRAVITQALMDALSRAGNAEAAYYKHEAINWLTGNSKDFVLVCLFAGFDPDYVRRKSKRALVTPSAWRAAPGKGKRYAERKEYRKKLKEKQQAAASPVAHAEAAVISGPWAIPA